MGKNRSIFRVRLYRVLEATGGGGKALKAEHTGAPAEGMRSSGKLVPRTGCSAQCP